MEKLRLSQYFTGFLCEMNFTSLVDALQSKAGSEAVKIQNRRSTVRGEPFKALLLTVQTLDQQHLYHPGA